ncbi:MAG: ATP-dependent RNA helicase RhlB [Pseudomonadota bacterium]
MSEKHLTDKKFSEFPLDDRLQNGIRAAGFEFCTPIQAASLPAALEGKDVAGQAQTGTGKTVAFLLACCHHLLTNPPAESRQISQPRALILAPTRELAIQIFEDAGPLIQFTGLTAGLVYGGTGYDEQKKMLQNGTDILIGTPGRLIDYYKQGLFDLKQAQVAIMDEADRMFDLGFIKDIRYLLRKMPPAVERLNLLYSATLSFRVMELAYEHMNDPEEIKIDADVRVADQIKEVSYYPSQVEKLPLLINLLKEVDEERALVFVNTRIAAETVSQTLKANGVSNAALSGEVPQKKRERLLESFKQGNTRVLVATDVAARGLHIPEVKHVYNYDLPQDAEDYVHRIGRTARAGASGEAISFICEKYAYSIMEIEEYIGHSLPKLAVTPDLITEIVQPKIESSRKKTGRDKKDKRHAEKSPSGRKMRDVTKTPALSDPPPPIRNKDTAVSDQSDKPVAETPPAVSETQTESKAEPKPISKNPVKTEQAPLKRVPNTVRFSRKFGEVPLVG